MGMFDNLDYKEIISNNNLNNNVSDDILENCFAKTITYTGIKNNFCIDIPEILEEEKRQQEKRDDIYKFTQLMMSDFDKENENQLIEKLFSSDEMLSDLSNNTKLLSDLDLL